MQIAERRPTLIFVVVLMCLLLVMTSSTKTRVLGETRTLLERMVMTVFSPIPKFVNWTGQQFSDAYHGYLDMRRSVAENVALRRQVSSLTEERLKLVESQEEIARLRSLLGYSEQFPMQTMLGEVIMVDQDGRFRSLIIDRGSDHGVSVNDAVLSPGGLIGRVVLTTKDLSKVQLVVDSNSAVGAIIDRSRRQGVVRGDGAGGLELRFVPSLTDVVPGDLIVTGGIDGIYPRGIPVGRVVKVEEGRDLFKRVIARPAADLGALEEVIILKTRKIPTAVVRYNP